VIRIGPADHGRRMSLDDFDKAIGQPGYVYELYKGVIEVSDVPKLPHGKVVRALSKDLERYDDEHPGVIYHMAGGGDCKLLDAEDDSERHPDWSIYLRAEPPGDEQPWSVWVPEIVVEVVSESSRERDYEQKPPQYLALGVMENWILDPIANTATFKTRWRGLWRDKVLRPGQRPGQRYATHLLPGLKLDVRKLLRAGR